MEDKLTPPNVILTVRIDGSSEINLPDEPFEMLGCLKRIYEAMLDYANNLHDRKKSTFVLAEHFTHQDFEQKLLNRTISDALLPRKSILQ